MVQIPFVEDNIKWVPEGSEYQTIPAENAP